MSTAFVNMRSFLCRSKQAEPTPETLREDIASAKEDIAVWNQTVSNNIAQAEALLAETTACLADIDRSTGQIRQMEEKLARVESGVHDGPNVTLAETNCRIIEPKCELFVCDGLCWITWETGRSFPEYSAQAAWRTAFDILSSRQKSEVPNE